MNETLQIVVGSCFVLMLGGLVLLVVRMVFFPGSFAIVRNEKPRYKDPGEELWDKELLNPDFCAAEDHLRLPIPQTVRQMYQNTAILLERDFDFIDPVDEKASWPISRFLLVNQKAIEEKWPNMEGAFFFAETDFHQRYFVRIDFDEDSLCPVFLFYPENERVVRVADSLHDFLGWFRVGSAAYFEAQIAKESEGFQRFN